MIDIRDVIDFNAFSNADKVRSFTEWKPGVEELQREFTFMCAARFIEDCTIQEVKDYFTLVLMIYESGDLDLLESREYRDVDMAAFNAAYRAADWAAYRAAYWAAYRSANNAAYRAAYRSANNAADWAERSGAERAVQVEMIKYLLDRSEG